MPVVTETANRLDDVFARLRERNEAGLVAFVTAGDPFPSVDHSADLIVTLAESGADAIELGIPYSDPLADGPSVQASSQRALEAGVQPPFVLDVVKKVRTRSQVPIVLMTYYNPVWIYGLERFANDAKQAGVDGLILTDLPPDEAGPWLVQARKVGIAPIFLLAPTSTQARIKAVTSEMDGGFVYCVSRAGVTGVRSDVPVDLASLIARIRAATSLPIGVGFGISTPDHVAQIARIADAAVIGSALVDFLHTNSANPDVLAKVGDLVRSWKQATRRN